MQFRSLSSLSRILIVACAAGLGTSSLLAQDASGASSSSAQTPAQGTATTSPKPMAPTEPYASRIDIFAGYSYLAPHGSITVPGGGDYGANGPIKYSSIDYGAIGSFN